MEETKSILSTLEHLVKCLLDYEAQLQDTRASWSASLGINLPVPSYQTSTSFHQLPAEISHLTRLIHDTKMVILEFIPHYFRAIAIQVNGQVYFVSKIKRKGQRAYLFVVQQKR